MSLESNISHKDNQISSYDINSLSIYSTSVSNSTSTNTNSLNNNLSISNNNISNNISTAHSIPQISFHFTNEKAGMEGLDREEIDKIIFEATKDSAITKKKKEELDRIKLQVEDYKIKLESLYKNDFLLEQNRKLAEARVKELKKERNLERIWMHIDMDMFYAAVEVRDNPSLKDKPVAVGSERMVATSNYIARKFGVRSAMPGFIGKKLCKDLIFIQPNFYKYEAESKKIMKILKEYDPDIEVRGLDEAYLDLTQYCGLNYITTENEIRELIKEIKKKIFTETQLTSSCGVACNKTLAKICSDIQKPDGLYILPNDITTIEDFMKDMKVRKIPCVGEKLERKLNYLNIFTCKEVIDRTVDLYYLFSETQFDFLIASCFGIGPCYHEEVRESIGKSISCSETFRVTNDLNFLTNIFHQLCKKLYQNMVEQSVIGKTLTIEITDKNERHSAKSVSIIKRFETEGELVNNGWTVLKSLLDGGVSVRLIRVKLSSLQQVNPETLKKKDENMIKHWIGKLGKDENKIRNKAEGNNLNNIGSTNFTSKDVKSNSASKIINNSKSNNNQSGVTTRSKGKSLNSNSNGSGNNLKAYSKIDDMINKMREIGPIVKKEKDRGSVNGNKLSVSNNIDNTGSTDESEQNNNILNLSNNNITGNNNSGNFFSPRNLKRTSNSESSKLNSSKSKSKDKSKDKGKANKRGRKPKNSNIMNNGANKNKPGPLDSFVRK
jgi:DNA polymerase kappa